MPLPPTLPAETLPDTASLADHPTTDNRAKTFSGLDSQRRQRQGQPRAAESADSGRTVPAETINATFKPF